MKSKTPKVKIKTHVDNTEPRNRREILVFGSNMGGIHGGGAARLAYDKYGAVWGDPEGLRGRSYAIPTKNRSITRTLSLDKIYRGIRRFNRFAVENTDREFFITRVACGLAGLKDHVIAPMFLILPNCNYPEEWEPLLLATLD